MRNTKCPRCGHPEASITCAVNATIEWDTITEWWEIVTYQDPEFDEDDTVATCSLCQKTYPLFGETSW